MILICFLAPWLAMFLRGKVFQGILLFYVLACDSLIVYRIRLLRSVRKSAHAAA